MGNGPDVRGNHVEIVNAEDYGCRLKTRLSTGKAARYKAVTRPCLEPPPPPTAA